MPWYQRRKIQDSNTVTVSNARSRVSASRKLETLNDKGCVNDHWRGTSSLNSDQKIGNEEGNLVLLWSYFLWAKNTLKSSKYKFDRSK